jgi:hypothetical protein
MRITVPRAVVLIALALLTQSAAARQQAPERKPVPSFSDDDVPRGAPAPVVSAEKPDGSWGNTLNAWDRVKSFRADVTMELASGRLNQRIEVVQPDRIRMTSGQSEIILIGSEGYARLADGPWQKYPVQEAVGNRSFKDLMMGNLKSGGNPKLIGADKVDGAAVNVYEFASMLPGPNGTSAPVTSRVWIGALDGLPRKMETKGADGTAFRVLFYDINRKISIEAPM